MYSTVLLLTLCVAVAVCQDQPVCSEQLDSDETTKCAAGISTAATEMSQDVNEAVKGAFPQSGGQQGQGHDQSMVSGGSSSDFNDMMAKVMGMLQNPKQLKEMMMKVLNAVEEPIKSGLKKVCSEVKPTMDCISGLIEDCKPEEIVLTYSMVSQPSVAYNVSLTKKDVDDFIMFDEKVDEATCDDENLDMVFGFFTSEEKIGDLLQCGQLLQGVFSSAIQLSQDPNSTPRDDQPAVNAAGGIVKYITDLTQPKHMRVTVEWICSMSDELSERFFGEFVPALSKDQTVDASQVSKCNEIFDLVEDEFKMVSRACEETMDYTGSAANTVGQVLTVSGLLLLLYYWF